MTEPKLLILSIDEWNRIMAMGEESINAIYGKLGCRPAKDINGDELVNAFIRGFNFHAAGQPEDKLPVRNRPITIADILKASAMAYKHVFGHDSVQDPNLSKGKNGEYYQHMADVLNGVIQ